MSNVRGTTFTAPRCRILMDGKTVGRGTNVSYQVAIEYQDVDVIDNFETEEYAPVSYKVSGSIGLVGIVGTTVKSRGMMPQTGKTADEHLLNVLLASEHVLVLMDKAERKNLRTINRVVFTQEGFSLAAGGIAGNDVQFKGIRETDESEASL